MCAVILGVIAWCPAPAEATNTLTLALPDDFGSVELGDTADQNVGLSADGAGCTISVNTLTGTNPGDFLVDDSGCDTELGTLQACTLIVSFAPTEVGARSADLTVESTNCNDSNTQPLTGTGSNERPSVPVLVYPADAATDIPTSLTFVWKAAEDPQGDAVAYTFFICTAADFAGCDGVDVTAVMDSAPFLLAGAEGLMGLFLIGIAGPLPRLRRKGRKRVMAVLIAVAFGALACTSSSDDSDNSALGDDEVGYAVTGLQPNTTYSWKVQAVDPDGNTAESDPFTFTTE